MNNWFITLKEGKLCGDLQTGTYITGVSIQSMEVVKNEVLTQTNKGLVVLDMDKMDRYFRENHFDKEKAWIKQYGNLSKKII